MIRSFVYIWTLVMGWTLGIVTEYSHPSPQTGTPVFWAIVGVVIFLVVVGLIVAIALDFGGDKEGM